MNELKELRFTSNTAENDFQTKLKHAEKFLRAGKRVKATVLFKGRNIMFLDRGELLLLRLAEALSEIGKVENMPRLQGKQMTMIINPKKRK